MGGRAIETQVLRDEYCHYRDLSDKYTYFARTLVDLLWSNAVLCAHPHTYLSICDDQFQASGGPWPRANWKEILPWIEWDELSDRYGFTAIHKTVCGLDHHDLQAMLRENPLDVNKQDIYGNTPLYYAVSHRLYEQIRLLLERGANPSLGCEPPLAEALRQVEFKLIEPLLNAGAIVNPLNDNIFNKWFQTHFYELKLGRKIDKLLLKHGIDVNHQSNKHHGSTILMLWCKTFCCGARIEHLISHGADLFLKDHYGRSAACYAMMSHDPKRLQILHWHGALMDSRAAKGGSILHCAIYYIRFSRLLPTVVHLLTTNAVDLSSMN